MVEMVSQDILVPTDLGPGSRLALERAIRSLGLEGGTLCIVPETVVPPATEPEEEDASHASERTASHAPHPCTAPSASVR